MAKETRKPRVLTKKHLARVERERLQRRYIIIITGIVVVLAVGLAIIGIFGDRLMEIFVYPRQPVAIVNEEKIFTPYFQDRTRYARLGLVEQAYQAAQLIQMFQDSPDFQQYYQSNLQQIAMQLDPTNMGQQVLDMLIEETLIRQEAERRGITVTAEEIEKALQENFGYFANGTPTPTATRAVKLPATLSSTQLALVTATPTITPTLEATPTITSTLGVTSTPTPTIEFTSTPTQIPTQTPTLGPTPTPTPYTFEAYQTNYKKQLEALKEIGYNEGKLRNIVEISLLRQKVMDVIEADLKQEQDQVWIRHILVADEATANQALDRLNKGEDFGTVAAELSTDQATKSSGGDLEKFYQNQLEQRLGKDVAEAVFNLHQVGEISKPILGSAGWHVVQLLGREERRMTTNEFEQFRLQRFREWILAQRDASDVQIFDYWTNRVPTEPALDPNLLQSGLPLQ